MVNPNLSQPYPTLSTHHAMSSLTKKKYWCETNGPPKYPKYWENMGSRSQVSKIIQNYLKLSKIYPKLSKIIQNHQKKLFLKLYDWPPVSIIPTGWSYMIMSITQCPPKLPRYWNNLPNVVPKDPWSSCRAVVESAPPNPKRWWFPATRHDAPRGGINKRNLETNPTTNMTMEKSAFEDVQYLWISN